MSNTSIQFTINAFGRNMAQRFIAALSNDQLKKIPAGLNQNILWNMGHIICIQKVLCYQSAGLPTSTSDKFIAQFHNGTSANEDYGDEDIQDIKNQWLSGPGQVKEDHDAGLFKTYNTFEINAGLSLKTIEDAITFNNFHEAIHLGKIIETSKLV